MGHRAPFRVFGGRAMRSWTECAEAWPRSGSSPRMARGYVREQARRSDGEDPDRRETEAAGAGVPWPGKGCQVPGRSAGARQDGDTTTRREGKGQKRQHRPEAAPRRQRSRERGARKPLPRAAQAHRGRRPSPPRPGHGRPVPPAAWPGPPPRLERCTAFRRQARQRRAVRLPARSAGRRGRGHGLPRPANPGSRVERP